MNYNRIQHSKFVGYESTDFYALSEAYKAFGEEIDEILTKKNGRLIDIKYQDEGMDVGRVYIRGLVIWEEDK